MNPKLFSLSNAKPLRRCNTVESHSLCIVPNNMIAIHQHESRWGSPGVPKDEERAFEFATAGAALGCAHSKGALARCYVLGYGVAQNVARALALGRESEAAGSCFGQFVVAVCYNAECGVAPDYTEVVRLYRLAAAQGHGAAQINLGTVFENGLGVAQDYAEAVRLYRLSARRAMNALSSTWATCLSTVMVLRRTEQSEIDIGF